MTIAAVTFILWIRDRRERKRLEALVERERMSGVTSAGKHESEAARRQIDDFEAAKEALVRRLERQSRESLSLLDQIDEHLDSWQRRIRIERERPSLSAEDYELPRATAREFRDQCIGTRELFRDLTAQINTLLGHGKRKTQAPSAGSARVVDFPAREKRKAS